MNECQWVRKGGRGEKSEVIGGKEEREVTGWGFWDWGMPPSAGPPSPGPGHDHFRPSEAAWDSHSPDETSSDDQQNPIVKENR